LAVWFSYGSSVGPSVHYSLIQDDAGRAYRSRPGTPPWRVIPKANQHDAGQEAIIDRLDPHVELQARANDDFEVEMCADGMCRAELLLETFFDCGGRTALLMLRTSRQTDGLIHHSILQTRHFSKPCSVTRRVANLNPVSLCHLVVTTGASLTNDSPTLISRNGCGLGRPLTGGNGMFAFISNLFISIILIFYTMFI
jgi:hypothetical protein